MARRGTGDPAACRGCPVVYPPDLIEAAFGRKMGLRLHRTCYPCRRTRQDDRKKENRWYTKARDTIKLHAERCGVTQATLIEKYGWNPDRMAREMAAKYADGLGLCDECQRPYGPMGHGPADLTLDISRPDEDPYYGTNTRYICMSENREKHLLGPAEWQLRKRVWAWWNAHRGYQAGEDPDANALGLLF